MDTRELIPFTPMEFNVLLVALDHMDEHLYEVFQDCYDREEAAIIEERMQACESVRQTIKQLYENSK